MATQIVVLEVTKTNQNDRNVRWLFWLYPAAGREVPNPLATSAFRNASTAEKDALKAGTVVEEVYAAQFPASMTNAQVSARLVSAYQARATEFAAQQNPNELYGTKYDSVTGWGS